jgi:hypothetical protein
MLTRVVLALTLGAFLSGCVVAPPPGPRGAHWVPGHYNARGFWVPGHWT